jgi:hypothetical protein
MAGAFVEASAVPGRQAVRLRVCGIVGKVLKDPSTAGAKSEAPLNEPQSTSEVMRT